MECLGKGSELTTRIFELGSSSAQPQAVVTASDSACAAGYVALFSGSQGPADAPGEVTFDNFYADTAEPAIAIAADGLGHAVLTWPATLASIWTLQTSVSVAPGAVWTEISGNAAQAIHYDSATGMNTYTEPTAMSATTSTYFRLNRLDPVAYP